MQEKYATDVIQNKYYWLKMGRGSGYGQSEY